MTAGERDQSSTRRVLPRGRNALSREAVAASQRERIFEAMTELVARDGYVAVSVAGIVAHAGVSKPTFYEFFESKEACVLALIDEIEPQLLSSISSDLGPTDANEERIRRGLSGMIEFFASDIDRARVMLIETPASGIAGQLRIDQTHDILASLYIALRDETRAANPAIPELSRVRAISIVGAVNEPLVKVLRAGGDAEAVRELLDEIVDTVTLLALGHSAQ